MKAVLRGVFAILVIGWLGDADAAQAVDDAALQSSARELRHQGYEQGRAGDYRGALEKLHASIALFPEADTAYDLAQIERELGQHLEALRDYRHFLAMKKDDPDNAELARAVINAREAIDALTRELAVIEATSRHPGVQIMVDAEGHGVTPCPPIEVLPGLHRLVFRRGAVEKKHELTLTAGERQRIEDDIDPPAPPILIGDTPKPAPATERPFYKRWYFWSAIAAVALASGGATLYATRPQRPSCSPDLAGCVAGH